jgi:chromosome partitioning protein
LLNPLRERYDAIIVDTGPSLGILTVNAITASDGVIIPVTPQLLSAVGLKLLINTIQKVRKHINPAVAIEGILMTMCDTRTNLYREVRELMDKTYSQSIRIFDTIIPHSTKVGEANLLRKSVVLYDAKSKPAQAYQKFAEELIAYA